MTAAPETRRFHLSLRRILPLLAGCFLFVGAGAWMILHASAAPSLAARYIIPVAGWLSILFFGTGAVALTVALLLRKRFPLVEVLPEGLKLHSILKPAKGYFFPWESIEAFSRVRIAGNDLVAATPPIRSTTSCSTQLPARWNALSKSILPPTAPEAKGNRHPEKADSVPKRVVTASVTTFSYLCPQEQPKKSLEAWTNPNSNGCCGS